MTAINPLPSLIRASAEDVAHARMRKANRTKWNRGDFNTAASAQERLIRTCYGRADDTPESKAPFIRFGIAEQLQREGVFHLRSDFNEINAVIDEAIAEKLAAVIEAKEAA